MTRRTNTDAFRAEAVKLALQADDHVARLQKIWGSDSQHLANGSQHINMLTSCQGRMTMFKRSFDGFVKRTG